MQMPKGRALHHMINVSVARISVVADNRGIIKLVKFKICDYSATYHSLWANTNATSAARQTYLLKLVSKFISNCRRLDVVRRWKGKPTGHYLQQDNSYSSNDTPVDELPPFVPSPRHIDSPEPELTGNVHQSKRARVEDVEDEDNYNRYARDFPTPTEEFGEAKTTFEEIFEEQRAKGESPWTPFADKDEWELARWLVKNANQRATEEFLKMPGVST